ncbi:MAG: aminoglycoside phosphotransferase family protein [Ilumatobacter sp.]
MAVNPMPAAEVEVSERLVRSLLDEQHPDLAGLDIVQFANGWDNVMFRLGTDLVVRVPRRQVAARLIAHEQAVLPRLAPLLPLHIPAPVRAGRPSERHGYPWSWSILPWLRGHIVAETALADPTREAQRLGEFLAVLHRAAPDDAPPNPVRGHFVGENTDVNEERCASFDRSDEFLGRWHELVDDVGSWRHAPVWLHGDLHAANILANDEGNGLELSAVIDWGDVCAGDPATDLSVAWALFDEPERQILRVAASTSEFGVDDDTWRRAEAWALHFAIVYRFHTADNAVMASAADHLVSRLL